MPTTAAFSLKQALETEGTVMTDVAESFLSPEDFEELERLAEQLPYEQVDIGDVGEPNSLMVGRFMTDVEAPKLVNRPLSDRALEVVTRQEYLDYFRQMFGLEEVFIRRMQVNSMHAGSFVGHHLDVDSNPDYVAAVMLQFGRDFTGGDFVVYGGGRPARRFAPPYKSVMMSDCHFPHEVAKVESGNRVSLVYFVSGYGGPNRRNAEAQH